MLHAQRLAQRLPGTPVKTKTFSNKENFCNSMFLQMEQMIYSHKSEAVAAPTQLQIKAFRPGIFNGSLTFTILIGCYE